jgi:hypothetical protein
VHNQSLAPAPSPLLPPHAPPPAPTPPADPAPPLCSLHTPPSCRARRLSCRLRASSLLPPPRAAAHAPSASRRRSYPSASGCPCLWLPSPLAALMSNMPVPETFARGVDLPSSSRHPRPPPCLRRWRPSSCSGSSTPAARSAATRDGADGWGSGRRGQVVDELLHRPPPHQRGASATLAAAPPYWRRDQAAGWAADPPCAEQPTAVHHYRSDSFPPPFSLVPISETFLHPFFSSSAAGRQWQWLLISVTVIRLVGSDDKGMG